MTALKVLVAILELTVQLPIWYYLMYKVLQMIHATEVMLLLYWVYITLGVLMAILGKIVEWDE